MIQTQLFTMFGPARVRQATIVCALVLVTLALLILAGCGQPEAVTATPPVKTPPAKAGAVSPRIDWEQKWQTAVVDARKEGKVSIYSVWTPSTRTVLTKAFTDKYGIELEFMPFGRGSDLAARSVAEARAGLYLADVYAPGSGTLLPDLKPANVLGKIEPLLVLPEVLDPKAWITGGLPFVDKDGTTLMIIGAVQRNVVYNLTLVRDGEITSYKDLLKAQYKGKMILNDPSVAGGTNATLVHLSNNLWGEAATLSFLRALVVDQQVLIQRDHRLHIEWLARGKYAIGFGPLREVAAEFIDLGAPLKYAVGLQEENRISPSTGAIGVAAKLAHPNATVVFLNWLLTKEGQSVFAPTFGSPSTRIDASTQGIDPLAIPKPGQKYYGDSEEEVMARPKWQELAKKIIAETAK